MGGHLVQMEAPAVFVGEVRKAAHAWHEKRIA